VHFQSFNPTFPPRQKIEIFKGRCPSRMMRLLNSHRKRLSSSLILSLSLEVEQINYRGPLSVTCCRMPTSTSGFLRRLPPLPNSSLNLNRFWCGYLSDYRSSISRQKPRASKMWALAMLAMLLPPPPLVRALPSHPLSGRAGTYPRTSFFSSPHFS